MKLSGNPATFGRPLNIAGNQSFLRRREALWPPKPKLLLMATVTLRVAGLVGDVIQIALGIGVVEVDRGGDQIALDGQGADDGFDAAAGAQEVAQFALGGADGELFGVIAEGA